MVNQLINFRKANMAISTKEIAEWIMDKMEFDNMSYEQAVNYVIDDEIDTVWGYSNNYVREFYLNDPEDTVFKHIECSRCGSKTHRNCI